MKVLGSPETDMLSVLSTYTHRITSYPAGIAWFLHLLMFTIIHDVYYIGKVCARFR